MKAKSLFPLLALFLCLSCSVGRSQCLNPYSVTGVQAAPGSTRWVQLFANQLDQVPDNTLQSVVAASLPNKSAVVTWTPSGYTGTYSVATRLAGVWNANPPFLPGEGAFFNSPGLTAPTINFTGTPRSTETPVTIIPGNWYLLSRQFNCPATYDQIVNRAGGGTPAFEGLRLYRLKQSVPFKDAPAGFNYGTFAPFDWALAYDVFTYTGGSWFPFEPVMRVGEAVWVGPSVGSISGTARENNSCPAITGSLLRNWQINLTGQPTGGGPTINLTTFTDINGNYVFYVPPGNYTVTQVPDSCWVGTCPTTPYNVNIVTWTNYVTGMNFGAKAINTGPGTKSDLSVQLYAKYPGLYGAPCCGELMNYKIFYRNTCKGRTGVTLRLTIPPEATFIPSGGGSPTSSGWTWVSGTTYSINIGSLGIGAFGSKTLQVRVNPFGTSCSAMAPQTLLTATANIFPNSAALDANPLNNTFAHSALVTCSYDPNDKAVSPKGCGPTGLINSQPLTYTIRFQNLGSGPAYEVQVHDQLDPNLDPTTLEILGASHNYGFTMNGTEMVWTFPNILLPAAVDDEDGSNGYITYRVNPLPSRPEGTLITNQAAIYFDNNPPVLTPTTTNTITLNPMPVSSSTVTPRLHSSGHTNDFTYTGGTVGATFYWDFGPDATPATSTDMNPTGVIFPTNGLRHVSLRVSNGGCDSTPFTRLIHVGAPTLNFEIFEDLAALSWEGEGYLLQEASSLAEPVQWQTISPVISQLGTSVSTTLSPTNAMRFYRLVDQP